MFRMSHIREGPLTQITFTRGALPKSGAIVAPYFEDTKQSESFAALDKSTKGALKRAVKSATFAGKKDQSLDIVAPSGLTASRIVLIGCGKASDLSEGAVEAFASAAAARLSAAKEKTGTILTDGLTIEGVETDAIAARTALAASLRLYRFDKYRTREDNGGVVVHKLAIHGGSPKARTLFQERWRPVIEGVVLSRDLASEPPNILHPESFAERAQALSALGLKVTVLGKAQMEKLGMGALLGVGQGSARESKLVALEWKGGAKGEAPVAFVGKGVTFDTGGISLKPSAGMEDMKWDMGGAGAVTGLLAALAGRKARVNAVGVLGLVENMPDGAAQRPGDIVKTMSGQTVEVLNTDAEGRLVLADAIWWTQETYAPRVVIDLATLTGAIIVALGHEYAGLFSPDDALASELADAGRASGEKLWRMPVEKAHDDMLKSDAADMKNIGGKDAGSSSAAAFIRRFVKPGQRWAHLDIAGRAWTTKDLVSVPKGATGFGVRLLDAWVEKHCELT